MASNSKIFLTFLLLIVSINSWSFSAEDLLESWYEKGDPDSLRFFNADTYSQRYDRDRTRDSLLFNLYTEFVEITRKNKDAFWYARARASEIDVRHGFYETDPTDELESLLKELAPLGDAMLLEPAYDRLTWYCHRNFNVTQKLRYELEFSQLLEQDYSTSPEYIMLFHRIGEGYQRIKKYDSAYYYYDTAAKIAFSVEDWNQVGGSHYNLAYLCKSQDDTAGYKLNIRKALKFALKTDNIAFISMLRVLNSITYAYDGNFELAHAYLNEGRDWFENRDATTWIIQSYLIWSEIDFLEGKYDDAVKHSEYALSIAEDRKLLVKELHALEKIHTYYSAKGQYNKAYESILRYTQFTDSLDNTEQTGESAAMLNQYLNDKKALKDSLQRAQDKELEDLANQAKFKSQENTQYALAAGAGFMLILALILYRGFSRKKKDHQIISEQKLEVERQKDEIESQHQEIRDSIEYAKRIQGAILPPKKLVDKILPNSFILYKPKDVVAGDFYWLEERDGKVLFAAADCTGHGVPGAMVSVICNNGLNRSVREHGLLDPSKILDKTREIVIQEFEKADEEVKDGMDISLCCLDRNKLSFSGAHNSAWIIRKDTDEVEILAADKQPIGQFSHAKSFTLKETTLQPGDTLYLTTDGYADQFGGDKGKKFKTANFKRLLVSLQDKSMSEQKELIDQAFENWAADHEQIDDVCVIGFRYESSD